MIRKVRPRVAEIRKRCIELPRLNKVSIHESVISYHGRSNLKQHVPRKPNPDGLKMFVLASPEDLILNFENFQGKEALISTAGHFSVKPNRTVSLREATILRFLPSLKSCISLYLTDTLPVQSF